MSNQIRQPFGGILSGLFAPGKNQPAVLNKRNNVSGLGLAANTTSATGVAAVAAAASQINIIGIFTYIVIVTIIVLIFLIFIDRFITPVFKLKPGAPGYIPLPYGDDGVLYWKKTPDLIREDSTILSNLASGYTISLDIFIHNPAAFSKYPRKLFWRGPTALLASDSEQENPFGLLEFNLLLSLSKDTNDLIVSTMKEQLMQDSVSKKKSQVESVSIPNVPIRKPFRITIVMFSKLMEIYLNGKLYQTRTLELPPLPSFHFLNPPAADGEAAAAVRNLKIWNRCLTPAEVREMSPPLDGFSDFENIQPSCGNVGEMASVLTT